MINVYTRDLITYELKMNFFVYAPQTGFIYLPSPDRQFAGAFNVVSTCES